MFLDEISDDLLISLYREGNQVAIDLLHERYNVFLYGFIHSILKKENFYFEYKELFQELFLLLLNCIDRYDEDNGCFYFFVKKCVERKLFDIVKKTKKNKNVYSLDEWYYQDGGERYVDYVMEDNCLMYYETELYEILEDKLDEKEMKIINMKVEGYSYQEISNMLGISKQAIYRKVISIKNIVKDIIEKID